MRTLLSNDQIDQIVALDDEYAARRDDINQSEAAIRAAARAGLPVRTFEERRAWAAAGGVEVFHLHAENLAWYRAARRAITGVSWEAEMAGHEE